MMFERSLKPGLLQHRQLYQENEDEPLGLSMSHKQDPQLQVPHGTPSRLSGDPTYEVVPLGL